MYGDLVVDPQTRLVSVKGKEIILTAREYDMLWLLITDPLITKLIILAYSYILLPLFIKHTGFCKHYIIFIR